MKKKEVLEKEVEPLVLSKDSKVAVLNDSFPPLIDGVANTVMNYARVLNKESESGVVITPDNPDNEDEKYPYPILRYPAIDSRKMIGYLTGVPISATLVQRLKDEKVKVLHTHCPAVSMILARSLRTVINAPVVFTYHTKFDVDIQKNVPGKLMQEEVIKGMVELISGADEVWCVSDGAGKNLQSLGYKGKYIVMHNGVDIPLGRLPEEIIEKHTASYNLLKDVPVFLFVGRMEWYKGQRLILDALEGLKSHGIAFKMVFIGSGMDYKDIVNYADRLGLEDDVLFLGAVHDREAIRAWYNRANLLLFPSTYDTNGLVVREAAAGSVATVMIQGSCAAEGVTNDENGFLITETAASLAIKLAELCKNPALMKEVGENAARDLYISWDDAVKAAEERYKVVYENYHKGLYPKRKKLSDNLCKSLGGLLEFLGKMKNLTDEVSYFIENE